MAKDTNSIFDDPEFMQFFTAIKQRSPFTPIEHIVDEFKRNKIELASENPEPSTTTKPKKKK